MKQLNVYVIDTNQYRLAKKQLIGKGCNNCNNGTCRVLDKAAGCNCLGWENSSLVKKAVVLENYDINKLQSIPDLDGEIMTTEEMESRKSELLRSDSKVMRLV